MCCLLYSERETREEGRPQKKKRLTYTRDLCDAASYRKYRACTFHSKTSPQLKASVAQSLPDLSPVQLSCRAREREEEFSSAASQCRSGVAQVTQPLFSVENNYEKGPVVSKCKLLN